MWTHRRLATAATMWEARSAAAILGRGVSRAALIWLLVLMQAAAEDVAAPVPEADLPPAKAVVLALDTIWEMPLHWAQEGAGTRLAASVGTAGTRTFHVLQNARCAVWWRSLDQPVRLPDYPLLRLRMQAQGVDPSHGYVLSLLLRNQQTGQPTMRGVCSGEEIEKPATWIEKTYDLRELGPYDLVLGLKVEVWNDAKARGDAVLTLAPPAFLAAGAGAPAAGDPPSFNVTVTDTHGKPISGCSVTVGAERLNGLKAAVTGDDGTVSIRAVAPGDPRQTIAFRAPGYLPVEVACSNADTAEKVALPPVRALRGVVEMAGEKRTALLCIDAKLARPIIGRYERPLRVLTDGKGEWQAAVAEDANDFIVLIGADAVPPVTEEVFPLEALVSYLERLALRNTEGPAAVEYETPTVSGLFESGDNDDMAMAATNPGEVPSTRRRAFDALLRQVSESADTTRYYLLDLAWMAIGDEEPWASEAAAALAGGLRRLGVRPNRTVAYIEEAAGTVLPSSLRVRLEASSAAWAETFAIDGSPRNGTAAVGDAMGSVGRSRSTVAPVTLALGRSQTATEPVSVSRSSATPVVDLFPVVRPALPVAPGTEPSGRPVEVTVAKTVARAEPVSTTTGSRSAVEPTVLAGTPRSRPKPWVTPDAAARPASPGGVALDGLLRTTFAGLRAVDPVSASGDRKAAVEKVLMQNEMVEVRTLLAQGKQGEARAKALALAPGISTRSGLLALFAMIALTDTERDGMARRAVDDGLKALSGGGQEQLANAFVAGMLYLYQRDEAADVPKLYESYCGLQPGKKPDPGARLTLALCLIKAGKQADAYTQLSGVVHDSPTAEEAPKAALLLGWVGLSQQDYEKARRDLTFVATTYPRTTYADKARELLERLPAKL